MTVRFVDQLDIKNKRVLIRTDYNVPYDKEMNITDDTRIRSTLDTLNYCIKNNCKIILISHHGRPNGQYVPEMSLKPVVSSLSKLLNKEILFKDPRDIENFAYVKNDMKDGEIVLLENVRFCPGEKINDDKFGKKLASLADVYINDAFSTAHRKHASNVAVTKNIEHCAMGFYFKSEIEHLKNAIFNPERPFGVIIGGAKVSTKLNVMHSIISKVNFLIVGGGMAFTFLKAKGYNVGKSLLEKDLVESAKEIIDNSKKSNVELLLPVDVVAAEEFDNDSPQITIPVDKIADNYMGLDIGPESIKLFSDKVKSSKTVIWNGPMGVFEMPNFAKGTNEIAKIIAETDCYSIVGGGDSVAAVNQSGMKDSISYISTAGGAFLRLLEGKAMPAITALDK